MDIEAKTLDPDTARLRDLTGAQRRAMLLTLLQDRLGLSWHLETRTMPTLDLVLASGGPKLQATKAIGENSGRSVNDTRFRLTNVSCADLAVVLAGKLGRPVVDKTGLSGRYDITLQWSSDQPSESGNTQALAPLPVALEEELGLHLKSGSDALPVFVIDRLLRPSAN
jgi:uncharacterized protein (TIGR03435 family)